MIDESRFWTHVSLLDDACDSCWIWTGAMRDDGRGRFWQDGKEMRAHWAAWEIQHGTPVPEGYRLEQQCSQPQCVRHWALGRPFRLLTPQALRAICAGMLAAKVLAKKYGVSRRHVHRVRRTYVPAQTS